MRMKEVTLYLNENLIKDIDNIVFFLNSTEKEVVKHTFETFIIESVIKQIEDLNSYNELGDRFNDLRPYKIKNRFKEIAEMSSLTQKEISKITGINTTTLNLIFQNKHQPSLDNFFKLWVCLGYPPFKDCLYKELD